MSNDKAPPTSAEVFRTEAAAEEETRRLTAESAAGLDNRCTECGALGSLELDAEGVMRCIDCDEVVGRTARLGGLGRK
jgi:hypothetical protein